MSKQMSKDQSVEDQIIQKFDDYSDGAINMMEMIEHLLCILQTEKEKSEKENKI